MPRLCQPVFDVWTWHARSKGRAVFRQIGKLEDLDLVGNGGQSASGEPAAPKISSRLAKTNPRRAVASMSHPCRTDSSYEAHRIARQACLVVLEGKDPPDVARSAFMAACEEAGMQVIPEEVFMRNDPGPRKKKRRR